MKNYGDMEKGILRMALQGVLPKEILTRKKSPYPKTFHPSYTNAVRSWLTRILEDKTSPILPLIHVNYIQELLHTENEWDTPWYGQLMRLPQLFAYLAQINTWLREYKISIQVD
jgi:asparagine synthase (glutamine-hydrolysing)